MSAPPVDPAAELRELLINLLRGNLKDGAVDLGEKLDSEVLPALYNAASLKGEVIRAELRSQGLDHWDPGSDNLPTRSAMERTCELLVRRASRLAGLRGAAGSFGGFLTLAPDMGLALVQTLRLAQRLAVVWGHDPDSEPGRLLLTRALATAWKIDLPREGMQPTHLSQVPGLVRSSLSMQRSSGTAIARNVASRAAGMAGRRISSVVPGLGTGLGAWSARRQLREQGAAMAQIFAAAWEGRAEGGGQILEAVEVKPPDRP